MSTGSNGIEIFISYSHEDEALLKRLEKHLIDLKRAGLITVWHGRKISAGVKWEEEIDKYLSNAQIVLLLVSANFIASEYCYGVEFQRAMERFEQQTARVIAIILSPCRWRNTPLKKLQVLPIGAKPVTQSKDIEQAFVSIANGIEEVVKELRPGKQQEAEGDNLASPGVYVLKGRGRIKEAIRTIPALKYTLALAITIAMISIAGLIIDYRPAFLKPGSSPEPSPSATPISKAAAEPSARASISPRGIRITITEFPPYNPVGGPDSHGPYCRNSRGSRARGI